MGIKNKNSYLMRNLIEKILLETEEELPYKKVGDADSYSKYNEGWSDACDILHTRLIGELDKLSDVENNPLVIEVLKRYERWETKLMLEDSCWENCIPTLTPELFEDLLGIQKLRNKVIIKYLL